MLTFLYGVALYGMSITEVRERIVTILVVALSVPLFAYWARASYLLMFGSSDGELRSQPERDTRHLQAHAEDERPTAAHNEYVRGAWKS